MSVAFFIPFVLSGLAVLLAIYLQNVLGYSPLETGVLMLPLTIPRPDRLPCCRVDARRPLRRPPDRDRRHGRWPRSGVFLAGVGAQDVSSTSQMVPGIRPLCIRGRGRAAAR